MVSSVAAAGDAADIVSFGQQCPADAAVNRRADLGVFQVQLGGIERGLGGQQGGLGFLVARLTRVGFLD